MTIVLLSMAVSSLAAAILVQGFILVFVPSVFKNFPLSFRWVPRVVAIAVLLWLVLTSFALTISM
jgi:hypothetical protein